jgi:hypothetical protein
LRPEFLAGVEIEKEGAAGIGAVVKTEGVAGQRVKCFCGWSGGWGAHAKEWWSGGVVERWSGGVVEWWSGGRSRTGRFTIALGGGALGKRRSLGEMDGWCVLGGWRFTGRDEIHEQSRLRVLGEFDAGLHIELAGGEQGDFGDALQHFGDPKRGHTGFEQAVAEVDDFLLFGAAGQGGKQDEGLAAIRIRDADDSDATGVLISRPSALLISSSTVSCGIISPPILLKRERRPSM